MFLTELLHKKVIYKINEIGCLEEKYEKRRELLLKIYRATDRDMNRQMSIAEFYNLAGLMEILIFKCY